MLYEKPAWKEDWEQTKEHFRQWWKREGSVLTIAGLPPLESSRDETPPPPTPASPRHRHTDPDFIARSQRSVLARNRYPADSLPIAHTDYGCVQLAACLGSEPMFEETTVWYADSISDPDNSPALSLTKDEPWWKAYKQIMLGMIDSSQGDFLVGMPAFGSNLDVVAELRGTQNLLFDLVDRPDWVSRTLEEINQAFFTAFDDYYEHIRLSDGSSTYAYFHIWGPGKVSQVQCDFAAMISPSMFGKFVAPSLQRQCQWLDHSLFHLDGPSCICHLEHLLAIEELDAVQWTPGAGQPGAGDIKWLRVCRRIFEAGKSVQIVAATHEEAKHILDVFGGKGIYLSVSAESEADADDIEGVVASMR